MNLNPRYWKWPQFLVTLAFLVFLFVRINVYFVLPSDTGIASGLINVVMVSVGPKILSLAIIGTLLVSHLYTYGLYYDIDGIYLLKRFAIPTGLILVEAIVDFTLCSTLHMSFYWKQLFIELGAFLAYGLSLFICYHKIEFRLEEISEVEEILSSYKVAHPTKESVARKREVDV